MGGVIYQLITNFLPIWVTDWEAFLGIALLILVFNFRKGLRICHDGGRGRPGKRRAAGRGVRRYDPDPDPGPDHRGILYFVSIGLSLTFGIVKVLNFAHVAVYALGIYLFISSAPGGDMFPVALVIAMVAMVPLAYVVERYVIRRLYGESVDYTIIATYAVLLIATNGIKRIWGVPQPVADPIGEFVDLGDATISVYRLSIVVLAFWSSRASSVLHAERDRQNRDGRPGRQRRGEAAGIGRKPLFRHRLHPGQPAGGSGGVLYAPMTAVQPYMGFMILLLGFATVIVGGMGNLNGTFIAAIALGLVMAITGRFWSQAAETMVFIVMGIVLMIKPLDSIGTAGK